MPAGNTSLRQYLLPPLLAAALGIAVFGAVNTLVAQAERLGPTVGDIVTFPPDPAAPRSHTRVTAERAEGGQCDLAVSTLRTAGGTLVVRERAPAGHRLRVSWAGARTTDDAASCGTAAELVMSTSDLGDLAVGAGGYGVEPGRTGLGRPLMPLPPPPTRR